MQISVMKCPHQCQVKPVRAGQVPVIREAEVREDKLEEEWQREEEEKRVQVPSNLMLVKFDHIH